MISSSPLAEIGTTGGWLCVGTVVDNSVQEHSVDENQLTLSRNIGVQEAYVLQSFSSILASVHQEIWGVV